MKTEKKFALVYLTVVSFLLISISSFNFYVDPLNIFNKQSNESIEVKLAKLLSIKKNIISENMNERLFVKSRIIQEGIEFAPHTIIVGSSRMMQVGSKILNHNAFNLSVSGASIEDLVAILSISTKKFQPKVLMVGVDPWIFNDASSQDRWQSLQNDYKYALIDLGINNKISLNNISSFKQLVNASYTIESIKYFYNNIIRSHEKKIDFADYDYPLDGADIIRKDGTRVYNLGYANQSQDSIIRTSNTWYDYAMSKYVFSENRQYIFKKILKKYKENYRLVIVLSPYHPVVYNKFVKDRPILLSIEDKIRSIADDQQVDVVGSFDPIRAKCATVDFYDGAHPKESCMRNVLKDYLN